MSLLIGEESVSWPQECLEVSSEYPQEEMAESMMALTGKVSARERYLGMDVLVKIMYLLVNENSFHPAVADPAFPVAPIFGRSG